jgi:hypothetical protein
MFSVQPPAENVCDAAKAVDVFFFPEADSASIGGALACKTKGEQVLRSSA